MKKTLLALALGVGSSFAQAQDTKPIHVIVPLLAGAGTDVVTRTFTNALSQRLNQPIVVENKAGGATFIGASYVAKAAPDGYTLLGATTSTMSVMPSVQKSAQDTLKELIPIAAFSVSPFVFGVANESSLKTGQDLIAAAKTAPGKLTFGSSGTGTLTHMVVELFSVVSGATFQHIPYKGVTGAYTDVIGGRINFLADAPASMLPQVRGGRMRALFVTSSKRLPTFPGIPTVAELGLPEAEADFTTGLFAPPGTPAAVITRLQGESLKVANSPEWHAYLATQGYEPLAIDGTTFGKIIKDGLAKWERVVKERNIKVE
jgi:tripartite-type tricarboxylate transporter receptor subunit TctC